MIQWARLGDLFHSRPLCEAALRAFHPASITFSCDEQYAGIVSSFPEVDEVLPVALSAWTAALRTDATLAEAISTMQTFLERQVYDVVISLTNHNAAKYFAALCDAQRVLGYGGDGNDILHRFEERVAEGKASGHIAQAWQSLVESPRLLRTPVSMVPSGPQEQGKRAVIVCDAGSAERSLTEDTIDTLCSELSSTYGFSVTLTGAHLATYTSNHRDCIQDLRGKTSLADLHNVLSDCSIVIGPDTGALHFAAAMGKKIVGLYLAGAECVTTGPLCLQACCVKAQTQDGVFRKRLVHALKDVMIGNFGSTNLDLDYGSCDLSIVITEHGQTHYADELIAQLRDMSETENAEIIVMSGGLGPVDEQLALSRTGVIADIAEGPRSFAEACNRGAMLARGNWLFFLNDDCSVTRESLKALLAVRTKDTIIGPRLKHWDGVTQSAGFVFNDAHVDEVGHGEWSSAVQKVDGVSAAAMLIERNVFQMIGGFDSGFKNGYEDVDYCLRAARQGISFNVAECEVTHYGGSSPQRYEHDDKNLELLRTKWIGQKMLATQTKVTRAPAEPLLLLSEEPANGAAAVLRWREPLKNIGLIEGIDFRWLSTQKDSPEECVAAIDRAEQIVVFRALASKQVQTHLLKSARQRDVRVIYDSDDLMIDRFEKGSPRASHRKAYEESIRELMQRAEFCTAATPGVLQQYQNTNVAAMLIETTPSAQHFRSRSGRVEQSKFNIGFAGGAAHQTDFALAAPALHELLDRDDNLRLYWWGAHPGELAQHPQVRRGGSWIGNYGMHLERIQRAPIDLWIVPLADAPHNAARSPLKAFEYIGMNAPCLFSCVEPYRSLLEECANGLLVTNITSAWMRGILRWRIEESCGKLNQELNAARHLLKSRAGRYKPYADLFQSRQTEQKRNFEFQKELEIRT